MSSTPYRLPLALPRLRRAESERALAGVCAGIAKSLRVDATLVRLTFALLAFAGGAGIAAYGGAWLALAPENGPAPSPRRRLLGYVALAIAGAIALRGFGFSDSLIWPAALCGAGILLARGRSGAPLVVGLSLAAVGVIVFVDQNATSNGRDSIFESSAVAIALLLVLGPWAWRLAAERDAERTARIRTEERAEMAARVHDSVLQTLALVQRESGDPRRVAALARRQERELRVVALPGSADCRRRRARRRDRRCRRRGRGAARRPGRARPHGRRARSTTASRRSSSPRARRWPTRRGTPARTRSRPSSTSATTRSRSSSATAAAASIPGSVPANAHGIAESIRGRMARAGGTATLASSAEGTEVELRLREAVVSRRRVVLVDDHDLFRAGVRSELGEAVDIVGEAGSVAEAVPLIRELDPDVVLLDVHLPDGGGHAVIAQIAPERPGVRFLALSVSDAAEDVIGVIRAGARGYVTKSISGVDLIDAVKRTADGDAVFSPRLAGFVLDAFRSGAPPVDPELDVAHRARAGGAAADRARLPVQGDRGAAAPVGEDGRDARLGRAPQAAALEPPRAHALGGRAPPDLSVGVRLVSDTCQTRL